MTEWTPADRLLHSLWGQGFEIALKAGMISALRKAGFLESAPECVLGTLDPWWGMRAADVTASFLEEVKSTGIDDPDILAYIRSGLQHVRILGAGLGQTIVPELLRRRDLAVGTSRLRYMWCPLQLPRAGKEDWSERGGQRRDFIAAWPGLFSEGDLDATGVFGKGDPGNADLALWFEPVGKGRPLLVLVEMSMNVPPDVLNHGEAETHLREITTYAARANARSVFSKVKAEVAGGEGFDLSSGMADLMPAFTGRDKPFYKLCQACSYLVGFARVVASLPDAGPIDGLALSVTHMGIESISATFGGDDPRTGLIADLGLSYRNAVSSTEREEGVDSFVREALDRLVRTLPKALSEPFRLALGNDRIGQNFAVDADESLVACDIEDEGGFHNPCHVFTREEAVALAGADPDVSAFLRRDPGSIASAAPTTNAGVSLRGLHGAFVAEAIRSVPRGQLAVLGLEGNPGIGKTTAARLAISGMNADGEGTLLVYVSPRLVINEDVTDKFAGDVRDRVLCLTTNSRLIAGAPIWHANQVVIGNRPRRDVDSAVAWAGLADLVEPAGACLFLDPEQKNDAEVENLGPGMQKLPETERRDRLRDERRPGVLQTLATAARQALKVNPNVRGLVLTAAMQGLRSATGLKGFEALFDTRPREGQKALDERSAFARRFPRVVFMVDEIAGDGAGAPFVVQARRFLEDQFLKPFRDVDEEPPFSCVLVAADASLSNEEVLARYLANDQGSPDKVLVSPSRGGTPFSLACRPLRLGPGKPVPALHVMTNSFPADRLKLRYKVRFTHLRKAERTTGQSMTERELIREQQAQGIIGRIYEEIALALAPGDGQVILFLQDKASLRDLRRILIHGDDDLGLRGLLDPDEVAIIDNNVESRERSSIVSDQNRSRYRAILMTSSGARGISFPDATRLIVAMPRFKPESALMEVAQVVYRGRGDGGDRRDREITLVIEEFAVSEDEPDPRRWMQRVSDLVTLACLARATLLTRITGDAGFRDRSLAIVPVGAVGLEGTAAMMSQILRDMQTELDSAKRDVNFPQDMRGLLANTERLVSEAFRGLHIRADGEGAKPASLSRDDFVGGYRTAWTSEIGPLVPDAMLPSGTLSGGPFVIERIGEFEEEFAFDGWDTQRKAVLERLQKNLYRITQERLPNRLRRAARNLYDILRRSDERQRHEFSTVKSVKASDAWLVIPADRGAFSLIDEAGRRQGLSGKDEEWRDALAASVGARKGVPVIPCYEEWPFFVSLGDPDPLGFEAVFDGRYLGATREFNLLNVLMLAKESPGKP